ncbi:hypothetical protein HPB50_015920 [Hyalomma asiaticum]|uniref:Uncharacterized protein n=1 Tax=Hyalomma asiaticum TaxID=266040 RepID=A0ACB7RUS1_HYAAI|nr:hypothetical protein HPB50_015920 [Hyalomma asiaticum]
MGHEYDTSCLAEVNPGLVLREQRKLQQELDHFRKESTKKDSQIRDLQQRLDAAGDGLNRMPFYTFWCRRSGSCYWRPQRVMGELAVMERLRLKRASRLSLNTMIINEARALLDSEAATLYQLNAIYSRLKANKDELRKINEKLESHIADEEFEQEYSIIVEYEDNATSAMSELLSK